MKHTNPQEQESKSAEEMEIIEDILSGYESVNVMTDYDHYEEHYHKGCVIQAMIEYRNQPLPAAPDDDAAKTIGQIVSKAIKLNELNPDVVDKKLRLMGNLPKLMNDEMYTNSIPIRIFCNLILSLHIPISKIESAMLPTFKMMLSKETPESIKKKPNSYTLYENEEATIKYLTRLKEIYEQQTSN